eukprot:COSAG05_NODE_15274_length_373_cov_2.175182_1_plen_98_part_10
MVQNALKVLLSAALVHPFCADESDLDDEYSMSFCIMRGRLLKIAWEMMSEFGVGMLGLGCLDAISHIAQESSPEVPDASLAELCGKLCSLYSYTNRMQ